MYNVYELKDLAKTNDDIEPYGIIMNNNNYKLTQDQLTEILVRKYPFKVDEIDLSNQDCTDYDIELMCKNSTFASIIKINLENNKEITDKAIKYLLKSKIIGSYSQICQISGKYGVPMTTIDVRARGTQITIKKKPIKYDFEITTSKGVKYIGIKEIDISYF